MRDRYHISMLVPGMPFDGNTLDNASLGGSETAGLLMARELARMGHWVRMFCNTPHPGDYEGVHYRGIGDFMNNLQTAPGDIVIVQRTPEPFLSKSVHRLHVLWCHDLAQGRQSNAYRSVCWNVDSVITVSKWMRQQYLDAYGLPHGLVYASRNGLDLARFPKVNLDLKKRKRLVYAARPERGLDVMLDSIFPALIEKDPEFELAIFGYANMVDHLKEFYAELADKARQFGDKVRFVGTLAKGPQYRAYAESGIYAYPTPSPKQKDFSEVSCISAAEAQAAGMPIVTSNRGALSETIHPDAGTLIDGDPWTAGYCMDFVDAILSYANDRDKYDRASQAGQAHAQTLGWDTVAEDWTQLFDRLIDERNNDRVRLAYHFYRRSDIIAARQALADTDDPRADVLKAKIELEYGFIASPDALRSHYVDGGKETTARLESAPIESYGPNFTETNEGRFHVIREYLKRHPEALRILDYGCGHGWSTIYLGNRLGRQWVGVDLDPGAIAWAQKCAEAHTKSNAVFDFRVGTVDDDGVLEPHSFDAVICSEVLEHCVDPAATFEKIEKAVRLGGLCIVTVPYGPSEYGTPNWRNFRNHLWEFDSHDLEDMFGDKPNYAMSSSPIYDNETTGEKIGFYFVTFKADHRPIGQIDMVRKLRLQRPRQTLSVSIMAGRNAEHTLAWCLDSVRSIADEIIIADTGLDPIGRMIAERYGVKLITGSDPLQVGFCVPRNEGLAACSMDWVLWIDTDEKLLDSAHLVKYIRPSFWQGLGIKQHHLAVDGGFKPDMPVRCFRRGPFNRPENKEYHGRVMSFEGLLHEHPELGMNMGPGDILVLPDVNIAHVGYLNETIRRKRFARNTPLMEMDQQKNPDRILQKHFVMRDNMLKCAQIYNANKQRINDEMRQLATATVELYRKHFLGKNQYAQIDSLQYYTQALQILQEGVDLVFHLAAAKDGIGDDLSNGTPVLARFANAEEAKTELSFLLDNKFAPFQHKYW